MVRTSLRQRGSNGRGSEKSAHLRSPRSVSWFGLIGCAFLTDCMCQRNNRMVWEETVRIVLDLFENVWNVKDEVVVDHAVEVTLPVSFDLQDPD